MNPQALADRVEALEHRVQQLTELADPDRDPFVYLMIEADATRSQVQQTHELLNDYWTRVKAGTETRSHAEFERAVYDIFPSKRNNYGFAESVIRTNGRVLRYRELYEYMREDGMNLEPL